MAVSTATAATIATTRFATPTRSASNYEDILPKPLMESLDPTIIRFVRPHGHQFYDASHSIRADGDYSHHSDHRGCYPNKISIVNPMSNKQEILLFLVSSKICEV
jgi:hypothetical protein